MTHQSTRLDYGYDFEGVIGRPKRLLSGGWFTTAKERDESARRAIEHGSPKVLLLSRLTDVTVTQTGEIVPDILEEVARRRVLATPTRTLFLSARGGVYERQYDASMGDSASLAKLANGKFVEDLNLPGDFWQSLRKLVPEAK